MVLKRLPRVLSSGIYVPSSTIDENYHKYILSSNPVRAFVETVLEVDEDRMMLKEEVYDAYRKFCKSKKLAIESEQSFSRKLSKEHNLKSIQIRDEKGARPYYWIGVKLKDWTATEGQSTF